MSSKKKESQAEPRPERLSPMEESYLKASKEIAVKFIETGRLSAAGFAETFPQIYETVKKTVEDARG